MAGTMTEPRAPDVGDPVLSGGPWRCHCGAVRSPVLLWWWRCGGEEHTARGCVDYGEIILPPGGEN